MARSNESPAEDKQDAQAGIVENSPQDAKHDSKKQPPKKKKKSHGKVPPQFLKAAMMRRMQKPAASNSNIPPQFLKGK